MSQNNPPSGPRPLPGQESSVESRAGLVVIGIVVVVIVGIAALLIRSNAVPTTSAPPVAPTSVAPTGNIIEIAIDIQGMAFIPSQIEVPIGDELRLTVTNSGDQRHDLVFANGAELEALAPGAVGVLDVGVISGDLEGWCSIPGHRQMGMTFTVQAIGGDTGDGAQAQDDSAQANGDSSPGGHGAHGSHSAGASGSTGVPTMNELLDQAAQQDPYPAELSALGDEREHHYTFTVTESIEDLADGLTRTVWTYNGTSPGPVLHGRVGDTFHITLVNDGTMGHSIDFHAGELAPDGPMRTIEPGESLEYVFTANRSGVWMYHCSTMPMSSHIANGMFGVVIIEPDDLEPVDRQYALVQSEIYAGADGQAADADKVAAGIPDVMTFNGRAFQYDVHPLSAQVGERVRIWVLNAGPNVSSSFHVVGTQFDTVWREGSYSVWHGKSLDGRTKGVTGAQTLPLQAAEGGFVEFTTFEPGHYPFVNHRMNLAEKGAHGILKVE